MKPRDDILYDNERESVVKPSFNQRVIDGEYVFIHKSRLYRFFAFLLFHCFVRPISYILLILIKRVKYINKKVLKQAKDGYFIYSNHVDKVSDVLTPIYLCGGKMPCVIVHPDNVSIPFVGRLASMCGALPLPDDISAGKNFLHAIDYMISKNRPIVIYPEANLWPYYVKIRDFDDRSFRYPVRFKKAVFVFTTTFVRRRYSRKPRTVIYIDGPLYVDVGLERSHSQRDLRDRVYNQMVTRSQNSNCEYVKYIKRGDG